MLVLAVLALAGGTAAVVMNVATPKEDKAVKEYLSQPHVKSSPFPEELHADFQQRGQWWVANGPAKDRDLKRLVDKGGKFEKLRFVTTDITGDGFALLKDKGVRNITIVDTKIDAKVMSALSGIEPMKELEIKGNCTDEMLENLHGPKSLEHLAIKESKLTNEAVRIIATNLPHVRALVLTGNKGINDGCVKYLKLFPKLTSVHITGTSVTQKGVGQIVEEVKVRKLGLCGLRITDDFVREHLNKPDMTYLNLSSNPITNKSLEVIAGMKSLVVLVIRDCPKISAKAIEDLKTRRPDLEVKDSDASVKKWKSNFNFLTEE